jgi:outer membrane murein-binding lipoprotein Lpp
MSPEELEAAREGANVDYAPDISYDDWQAMARALLAHIDSQAVTINNLAAALDEAKVDQVNFSSACQEELDTQAAQIETLKEDIEVMKLGEKAADDSDTGGAMSNSVDICPFDDDLTCPLDYHTCEIYRERMEAERLRSLNESLMENGNDLRTRCQKAEARIKELEADRIEARAQYLLFMNDNPGCIAWNFDELDETEQDALREQARYMLELEEPWAYIQLREAREQIKRLEAAFLKSETERKFYTTINGMNSEFDWNGYPECPQNGIHKEWFRQQAREALERIKEEREG